MPFNASGVFQRLYNWVSDRDGGIKILAPRVDAETDGLVEGLNQVVAGTQPFKGPVRTTYGTAATPSHSFESDPDTGMHRKSADVGALVAGGTEALEFSQTDVKILGSTAYRRANSLGTVSQSGGVPTGALIESGGNANGNYVRFASGLQICYFSGFTTNSGSGKVWTFPAVFSVTPAISAISTFAGARIISCDGRSPTQVTIHSFDETGSSAVSPGADLTAIGRWF